MNSENRDRRKQAVLELAERERVRFVNLQFTDMVGIVKSVTIPVHQFEDAHRPRQVVRRLVHRGLRPHRRERHVPRSRPLHLRRDPLGARAQDTTAKVHLQRLHARGRAVRRRPARRAAPAPLARGRAASGYASTPAPSWSSSCFEPNADGDGQPRPHDAGGYFDLTERPGRRTCARRWSTPWRRMGINVETSHHEVGHRASTRSTSEYDDALKTADNAVTFKLHPQGHRRSATGCTPPSCPSPSSASTARACTPTMSLADLEQRREPVRRRQRRVRALRPGQALHRRACWPTPGA